MRTNGSGATSERIVWQSKWSVTWYAVSAEGDYTKGTPVWDKFFWEHGAETQELAFLRMTYARGDESPPEYWGTFYPIENRALWLAVNQEQKESTRSATLALLNTNRIVHKTAITFVSNKQEMPKIESTKAFGYVGNEEVADMHLYDGNTCLLYRTFVGGLKYHVYHILDNRTEDISDQQASELKKAASGIHPVENLTRKLNRGNY